MNAVLQKWERCRYNSKGGAVVVAELGWLDGKIFRFDTQYQTRDCVLNGRMACI